MIRMTNKKDQATKVVYVDNPVVHQISSDPQIIYQDREVIKEVPVEVEKVVIQKEIEKVDLTEIHAALLKQEQRLQDLDERAGYWITSIGSELEMQRRALVGLKAQRDIDRNRRLMFIKRVKKERDEARKLNLKLKLAIGVSLIIAIVSLIVKL
jgi:hypothetical protein